MTKYAVKYCRIPTNYNDSHAAIVEAENEKDALELVRHAIGDFAGVRNHVLGSAEIYKEPEAKGRIVTLG